MLWIDGDIYDKLIADPTWGTPLNGDTPWVILFIKKAQVDTNSFKKLRKIALKYQGAIRFSWANQNEELLAATFDARHRPDTFLIKDGRVYHYPQSDYPDFEHLEKFLDGEYLNSKLQWNQQRQFTQV